MDSRKIVFRETGIIVVGEVILSAVMVAVFAALGYFQMNVLWGALAGCLVTTVNYFFLALVVCLASDRAAAGEVTQAQKMIQMSAVTRLLATGALLAVAILLGGNVTEASFAPEGTDPALIESINNTVHTVCRGA